MSTVIQPTSGYDLIETGGTIASGRRASGLVGDDPRRRRFGYNPGIWDMRMEGRLTGRQEELMPMWRPFKFETTHLKDNNFEIFNIVPGQKFEPVVLKEFTAEWFIANVKIMYAGYGFVELKSLTNLEDPENLIGDDGVVLRDKRGRPKWDITTFDSTPYGVFAIVHPSFATLKKEKIFEGCEFNDADCVTCRLELLDDGWGNPPEYLKKRIAESDLPEVGEKLRAELVAANTTSRDELVRKWARLSGELEKRKAGEVGLAVLGQAEHYVRKQIHEYPPSEQNALAAAGFGAQVGDQLATAFRETSNNPQVTEILAQMAKEKAESDRRFNDLMAQHNALLAKLAEK